MAEWVSARNNDVVPGFGEGNIPGFGNGGSRFGGRSRSRSGFMANGAIGTARGHMTDSKLMIGAIYGMGMVGSMEVQGVGMAHSGMA